MIAKASVPPSRRPHLLPASCFCFLAVWICRVQVAPLTDCPTCAHSLTQSRQGPSPARPLARSGAVEICSFPRTSRPACGTAAQRRSRLPSPHSGKSQSRVLAVRYPCCCLPRTSAVRNHPVLASPRRQRLASGHDRHLISHRSSQQPFSRQFAPTHASSVEAAARPQTGQAS